MIHWTLGNVLSVTPASLASVMTAAILVCSGCSKQSPAITMVKQANTKQAKGDLDGAIADYTKAIELKPDCSIAFYNRGIAKQAKNDTAGAIADFTRAIEVEPNSAPIYVNRGLSKFLKGDRDGAIADFTRAIELRPDFAGAYHNRGLAKTRASYGETYIEPGTGHTNTWSHFAPRDFDKTLAEESKLRVESGPIKTVTGAIIPGRTTITRNFVKPDMDGAIADFTKAIELNPKNAMYAANRAMYYNARAQARQDQGDKAGAAEDFAQAKEQRR